MHLKLAVALLGCSSVLFSTYAEEIDLFILAGQSNADGRGLTADLPVGSPFASPQDALIWYANPDSDTQTIEFQSDGFEALAPGFSNPPGFGGTSLPSGTFGLELSFASAIQEETGSTNQVAIVKVTEGGTAIRESRGEWFPSRGDNAGFAFTTLLDQVGQAIQTLEAEGNTVNVKAFLWHQGESDRNTGDYIDTLSNLIEIVRDEFGKDLAFVAGELAQRDILSLIHI